MEKTFEQIEKYITEKYGRDIAVDIMTVFLKEYNKELTNKINKSIEKNGN